MDTVLESDNIMTWLMIVFVITASVSAAPTEENYDNRLKSVEEDNSAELMIKLLKNVDRDQNEKLESDDETNVDGNSANEEQSTTELDIESKNKPSLQSEDKKSKKGRKHKALFIDYPFVPQLSGIPNFETYDDLGIEERTAGGGGRKRYPESNIYYIRLPPTPYMFVPGLGYVSQPPTYSTGPIRPQIPHVRPQLNTYRPHNVYNPSINDINPFINLPLDFVSNGKPTSVYQWQSPAYQTIKRPNTEISTLDKGPYFFNGRPHGIYLLRQDSGPSTAVHQSLQYPDYQDNSYY